jgi:large exoprotein involved in heme utilization and adhesion
MFPLLRPVRRRRGAFFRSIFSVVALILAHLAASPAYGLPTGAQVAAGNVVVSTTGASMALTQTSGNAVVNWQSFNIGAGEQVRIAQPGATAAMLRAWWAAIRRSCSVRCRRTGNFS